MSFFCVWQLLGCHGRPLTSLERDAANYPLGFHSTTNGLSLTCACKSRSRFACIATCGRLDITNTRCGQHYRSNMFGSSYGTGLITATCPAGMYVLGCGIWPRTGSTEKYRAYYPLQATNPRQCRCTLAATPFAASSTDARMSTGMPDRPTANSQKLL